MKDILNTVEAPDFIKKEFEAEDWYMIVSKLKKLISENIKPNNPVIDNVIIKGDVFIGVNCIIGSYVVIEGPVYIGNNVEIGSHAHIRAGSIISDNCVVGYTAGTKNSLMMSGAKIANHTFLGDSIMCPRSRLGGHAETANRRFDQGEIAWNFMDGPKSTGLDKLGSIIGEDSRIAGGVMVSPGTVIGKNTFISSGANVSGYIPEGKFVKTNTQIELRDNNFRGTLHQKSTLAD